IQRVFGVKMSGETLRPLLKELRQSQPVAGTTASTPETDSQPPGELVPTPSAEAGGSEADLEPVSDPALELFPELLGPQAPNSPAPSQNPEALDAPTTSALESSSLPSQELGRPRWGAASAQETAPALDADSPTESFP